MLMDRGKEWTNYFLRIYRRSRSGGARSKIAVQAGIRENSGQLPMYRNRTEEKQAEDGEVEHPVLIEIPDYLAAH